CFVDVRQRRKQRGASVHRRSLITAARPQVVISLREVIDQLLSRTLQVAAIRLRDTKAHAVRVNRLAVVLTISTLGHKPNRITFTDLPPVARHAHIHTAVEDRNALITPRWICHAAHRRTVGIVAGLLTSRITLAATLN